MQLQRRALAQQSRKHQGLSQSALLLMPLVKYHAGVFEKFRYRSFKLERCDIEEQKLGPETDEESVDDSMEPKLRIMRPVRAYLRPGNPKPNRRDAVNRAAQSECPICTQPFIVDDSVRILPCYHQYHQGCIDPWLLGFSGTCPVW